MDTRLIELLVCPICKGPLLRGEDGHALVLADEVGRLLALPIDDRISGALHAEPGSPPLEQRIAQGQRSVFFGHHADYAAVTSHIQAGDPARAPRGVQARALAGVGQRAGATTGPTPASSIRVDPEAMTISFSPLVRVLIWVS